MPSATSYLSAAKATRLLIVGDPGGGKSSTIAHLATSPLIDRLFVADLDDNWRGPLRQLSPDALAKIHIETLRDPISFDSANKFTPKVSGVPDAFPRLTRLLNEWVDSETGETFGAPETWTPRDAFILDGCTGLAHIAMNYTLYANNRRGKNRRIKDWGNAIERFEGIIQSLNSGLPCHVICTAHLARLSPELDTSDDDDDNPSRTPTHTKGGFTPPENFWMRYPTALGQKLPPRLGGMFEGVIQAKRVGRDLSTKHMLKTTPDADVDVKLPLLQKEIGGIEISNEKLIDIITKSSQIGG